MGDWNAELYLKFQKERTQPAYDLAERIPLECPARVADIGCGPGNSTRVLRERFPTAYLLGADFSENMLQSARENHPGIDFVRWDAAKEEPLPGGAFDLLFSNACLQWVPDHERVIGRLSGMLHPGGVLAVQVPVNQKEPVHQILAQLAASEKWKPCFSEVRTFYTLPPEGYFDLLSRHFSDITMWEHTYCHRMPSQESILEWYRSTGLKPYLEQLDEAQKEEFEGEVLERIREAYPVRENGEVLYRFPRFFFVAVK